MAIKKMFQKEPPQPRRGDSVKSSFTATGQTADIETEMGSFDDESKVPFLTMRTFFMAVLVSFGGLCFGYDTCQISGFLKMYVSVVFVLCSFWFCQQQYRLTGMPRNDFLENFADQKKPLGFSNVRSGLIVGMVSGEVPSTNREADG